MLLLTNGQGQRQGEGQESRFRIPGLKCETQRSATGEQKNLLSQINCINSPSINRCKIINRFNDLSPSRSEERRVGKEC